MITKYGDAILSEFGYYRITSVKEGNHNKLLHRLVWEDFYNKKIPDSYVIHHLNGDKTDNRIQNLQCVSRSNHIRFHKQNMSDETRKKISESLKDRLFSENHKQRLSEANKGKIVSDECKIKISRTKNTTGYFRVCKHKDKTCKQGFIWQYHYFDEKNNSKTLCSVDLKKLEKKVKDNGLIWIKFEN